MEKNLPGAFLQVAGAGPMVEHSQGASTHPGQPGSLPLGTTPRLTLIAELEADVRVTLVSGEEEIEVVAGADEELGHLGPVVNSDQRC